MGIADELKRASAAEDFFRVLEVPYQPEVLGRARLHILKRMRDVLAAKPLEGAGEAAVRAAYRSALEEAYGAFVSSSPIEQRVFKVHQDARRALLFRKPRT
jgi:nitrogenase-stabilizing/protective protein